MKPADCAARPVLLPPPENLRDRYMQTFSPAVRWLMLAVGVALLIAIPWLEHAVSGDSAIFNAKIKTLMIEMVIFAIAAIGLNVVTGYTGQLNLGFGAFMAIGAYTTGYLMKHGGLGLWGEEGWPFWAAIPGGMLHAGIWGVILGYPTLRLSGDYFAIVTFGFAELAVLTARNWESATGGTRGLLNIPRARINWFGEEVVFTTRIGEMGPLWALSVIILVIAAIATWRITQSRVGLAWRAIREDEIAAQSVGINLRWYKSLCFFTSAALGGLAGSILPLLYGGVFVTQFLFMTSVFVLVYVVFGGMGSISGAIAGAILLRGLLELLRDGIEWVNARDLAFKLAPESRFMVYGLVLILIVRFRPEGLFPSRRVARELHTDSQRIATQEDSTLHDFRQGGAARLQ